MVGTASTTRRRWPRADVGIAIGAGTDVAIKRRCGADLKTTLPTRSRPSAVQKPIIRNIKENLFWAFFTTRWASPSRRGWHLPFHLHG